MSDDHATDGRGHRGRLLVLVDNGVIGDSRVQKTARSAALAGWQVTLVGRSKDGNKYTWRLGDAEVRLIPVSKALHKRRHEYRRAPLRRPLAYPPGPLAAYRKQRMRAWRAELFQRGAELRTAAADGRPRLSVRAAQARLMVSRVAARIMNRWVSLRARHTKALERKRTVLDSALDRFITRFWQSTMGDRCWRRLDPHLWEFELAYGPVVDELRPDLIHANDFRMLGVGARAKARARAKGRTIRLVWDAHEFLPGIKPWDSHPRWHPAQMAHEREYAHHADAVVTVSERLADLLIERHGLSERPTVVLNAPGAAAAADDARDEAPNVRKLCGVGEVPLVIYSGVAAPQRGLDVMIEALPHLEGVHTAFVVGKPGARYVKDLVSRAEELGVNDRVHVLPYVPHDQVTSFLSGADVGVIPIQHFFNHEIALVTKFFEYSHARLPIVVSDVKAMAETTRSTGQGEIFEADNVTDYVRALRLVLDDPSRYRAAYTPDLLRTWTWEAQAERLDQLYTRLLHDGSAPSAAGDSSPLMVTA